MRSLLLLALFSGAAALVYEVVWMRWFRLLFGSTAYAASATLCAFFAGLAIGSAWFGRIAGRIRRPLRLYGWLEFGAALAALWVPLAVHLYDPIYAALYERFAETRFAFVAIKFGLALVAMLPSSILLGGTLPLLVAAYVVEGRSLGRDGGRLYAVNVLGALWARRSVGCSCSSGWVSSAPMRWAWERECWRPRGRGCSRVD